MIRRASEADAAAIAALSIEVWLGTYIKNGVTREFAEYVLAEFTVGRVRAAMTTPTENHWVSEASEGIAGYIRTSSNCDAPVEGAGTTEIATLYVQARHQGSGIGAALLSKAIQVRRDGLW